MENEQETLSYEQAYSELRQIIDRLENSDVNIDVLTKEIERAESLLDFCNKRLSQVEVDVQEYILLEWLRKYSLWIWF